jgi:hypothetical protein
VDTVGEHAILHSALPGRDRVATKDGSRAHWMFVIEVLRCRLMQGIVER